jgi:hypothetical protein
MSLALPTLPVKMKRNRRLSALQPVVKAQSTVDTVRYFLAAQYDKTDKAYVSILVFATTP